MWRLCIFTPFGGMGFSLGRVVALACAWTAAGVTGGYLLGRSEKKPRSGRAQEFLEALDELESEVQAEASEILPA